MKIVVPIKRVVDYNVKARPLADGSDVDIANAKMSINPFCEIAVEEAIRIKESGKASEVIVVSVGSSKCQEQLRAAMALGADRAILVEADGLEPLSIAKVLQKVVEREQPKLVLMGKQSIDGDNNQTGQMLSALLGWAQGTFASQVEFSADDSVQVTREVDGGLQTIELTLPAVITTDLRLNEPRYAKLPDIMKAKKKPLENVSLDDLGITVRQRVKVLNVALPPQRTAGVKVASVDELIDKLKNEAKVIS